MIERKLMAVVLGAGKGTRLASEKYGIPKVMRTANGKPLIGYVLERISFIKMQDTVVVVGYKKQAVMDAFPGYAFAIQDEQLGTGHAVMAARNWLEAFQGDVLVCYGDMPLIKTETYKTLIDMHRKEKNICTVLTGIYDEKMDYGRVVRDSSGKFQKIVEAKDCTAREEEIREYNSGIYVFDSEALVEGLGSLKNYNNTGEYYLTDVPSLLQELGYRVGICTMQLGDEMVGVNTQEQLELVEDILAKEN